MRRRTVYQCALLMISSIIVLVIAGCVPAEGDTVTEAQASLAVEDYDPTAIFSDIRKTIIHDPYLPPISARNRSRYFGSEFVMLGDWDGDGPIAQVVAVGDTLDEPSFDLINRGAVYILFLGSAGEIISHQRIDADSAGTPYWLRHRGSLFGWSLAALGDLDGPGESVAVLAVGTPKYLEQRRDFKDFGSSGGGVILIYLLPDGSVLRSMVIGSNTPNGPGYLKDYHRYGTSLTSLGDWDGRGGSAVVLAVGGPYDHSPHPDFHDTLDPTIYFHYILPDGSILKTTKLNRDTPGMPTGKPELYSEFGDGLTFLGKENGKAILAASAVSGGDLSHSQRGELYMFRLNKDLSISEARVLNADSPGAPPIEGAREGYSSGWYIGPSVVSLQPLLRRNNRGISYLLSTSGIANLQYATRIFALHDDFSIASYSTLTDDALAPINFGEYGEVIHLSPFDYIGVLDPAMPNIHSFAVGGQIHSETYDSRVATIIHQAYISLPDEKRRGARRGRR